MNRDDLIRRFLSVLDGTACTGQAEVAEALADSALRAMAGAAPAARLSRMLFVAREDLDMWADTCHAGPDSQLRRLIAEIDGFRAERGWSPDGFGREQDTPAPHVPHRGSDVEQWLKAKRDEQHIADGNGHSWGVLDDLLDDYRLHADTGQPLDLHAGWLGPSTAGVTDDA